MNTDAPVLDVKECQQFIQFWMEVAGVAHITLTSIVPDGKTATRTFRRSDLDIAVAWIANEQLGGRNIYFQPNETMPGCDKKPTKKDMMAALCRFADIDPHEQLELSDERFRLTRLAESLSRDPELPPTAIIDSGNGMQPIWAVAREVLSPKGITRIEKETRALEHALGAGGTHNIDRLLRLPGTVNFPNSKKRGLGRSVSRARLTFNAPNLYTVEQATRLASHLAARLADTDLVRLKPAKAEKGPGDDAVVAQVTVLNAVGAADASDIRTTEDQDLLTDLQKAGIGRVRCEGDLPPELRQRLTEACAARRRLRDRWAGLVDDLTAEGKDDSRSGVDFSFAASLKAVGFTHVDAALILAAFPHGKSNGDDWPNDDTRLRHIARCVARSYEPDPRSKQQAQAPLDLSDVTRFRLDLLTEGAPPPRRFLLAPLMPLAAVGLLYGPGGVGKSLVALELCLLSALRLRHGGGNLTGPLGGMLPEDAGGAAVFLTLEDDRDEIHRRTDAVDPRGERHDAPCYVIPAIDLPNFDPTLVTAQGRVAALTEFAKSGLDALLENIARASGHPVRLLALDPAGDFLDVDENDATFVKPLMRRLRVIAARHGCTIILLGHVAKSMDVDGPSMRGSSAWVANSRFAYALWPPAAEEAIKLARKLNVPTYGLVWGNLVKANHAGAPIGQKRLFLRNGQSGQLVDLTAKTPSEGRLSDDELTTMLVATCAEYAAAGMPFAYSGVAGLWNGRADLPDKLATLPKRRLEQLGTQALDGRLLVKARTTASQGAPKYLDVPDGPLSKGIALDMLHGSRREALARLKNAAAPHISDGDDVDN